MQKYRIANIDVEFGDARFDVMTFFDNDAVEDTGIRRYHSHGFYEIFLMRDAPENFVIGDKEVIVNPGEMIIVGLNCEHIAGFRGVGEYPHSVLSVVLEKTEGEKGFYGYYRDVLDSCAGIPIKLPGELFDKIYSCKDRFVCDSMSEYAFVKSDVSRILAELFSFLKGDRDDLRKNRNQFPLHYIKFCLVELVNSDMTISEIATELGYSERHTSRLIFNCFGKTLAEIRRDRKLATARKTNDR